MASGECTVTPQRAATQFSIEPTQVASESPSPFASTVVASQLGFHQGGSGSNPECVGSTSFLRRDKILK